MASELLSPSGQEEIRDELEARQFGLSTLSLPRELQAIVGRHLHGPQLAYAVAAGLHVDKPTKLRARHAYFWSYFFGEDDFKSVEQALQSKGNIFVIGYGLNDLYNKAFEKHNGALGSTYLMMSSLPKDDIAVGQLLGNGVKCSYPNVSLHSDKVDFHNRIMVDDVGKYLKNDNGRLWTSIVYFVDNTWGAHEMDVKFLHAYEDGKLSQYKYSLEIRNPGQRRWGLWYPSDRLRICLEEWNTNDVRNPRRPWHLALGAQEDEAKDESWWKDLITTTKAKGKWTSVFGSNTRGWWEWLQD